MSNDASLQGPRHHLSKATPFCETTSPTAGYYATDSRGLYLLLHVLTLSSSFLSLTLQHHTPLRRMPIGSTCECVFMQYIFLWDCVQTKSRPPEMLISRLETLHHVVQEQ